MSVHGGGFVGAEVGEVEGAMVGMVVGTSVVGLAVGMVVGDALHILQVTGHNFFNVALKSPSLLSHMEPRSWHGAPSSFTMPTKSRQIS